MHCGARHVLPPRYPTAAAETAAPRQLRQQGKNSMSQLVTIKGAHRSFASCTNPSADFSLFPGGNEKRRKGQLHPPAMPAVSCLPRLPLSKKGRFCSKIHKFLFLFFLNSFSFS
jgi:hypothetical protein